MGHKARGVDSQVLKKDFHFTTGHHNHNTCCIKKSPTAVLKPWASPSGLDGHNDNLFYGHFVYNDWLGLTTFPFVL